MTPTLLAGTTGPAVSNTCTLLIGDRIIVQIWHADGTVSLSFRTVNGPSVAGVNHAPLALALATAALAGFPAMTHKPEWMTR